MEKIISRKYILGCFILLFCSILLAGSDYDSIKSNLFNIAEVDFSKKILGSIFGRVGFTNLSDKSEYISTIIKIFNQGLLLFACSYISYSMTTSALNYAQHGGPMEAEKHSSWLPARMMIGTILLIPGPSGYTLMQSIVMSSVLSGIGLADTIWQKVVEQVNQYGIVPGSKTPDSQGVSSADSYNNILRKVYNDIGNQNQVLEAREKLGLYNMRSIATCVSAYKYLSQKQGKNELFGIWTGDKCKVSNGFCAGSESKPDLCGSYEFNSNSTQFNQSVVSFISSSILFVDNMFAFPQSVCKNNFCKDKDSTGISSYSLQANSLAAILKTITKNPEAKIKPEKNSWADDAIKQGWISAATSYKHFVVKKDAVPPSYDLNKIVPQFPVAANKGYDLNIKGFNDSLFKNIVEANQRQFYAARAANAEQIERSFQKKTGIANASNPYVKIADYTAKRADKVFIGVRDGVFAENNTIFSTRSNITRPLGWYKDISLTVARDNALVMIARIAGGLLGITLVEDGYWYNPGVMPNNQIKIFNHRCNGGISASGCLKDPRTGIIGSVLYFTEGQRVDPMESISQLGVVMLNTSLRYFVVISRGIYDTSKMLMVPYGLASATISAAIGAVAGALPFLKSVLGMAKDLVRSIIGILYQIDSKGILAYVPFSTTIASIFFVAGVMLAIYIPFVPFMIFTFSVVGWVIAVIEAMLAAPLIALGVTHPQGHDLLGKSEQSVILLLSVFVRPAAILIGFIASVFLMYVAWILLNTGFMISFASYLEVLPTLNGFVLNWFVFLGICLLYIYIIMGLVNQVFGLTYHVPEKLMRWIGLAPEVTGVSQMLGQVQQGVQGGFSQASEAGKQTAMKVPKFDTNINIKSLGKHGSKLAVKGGKKLFSALKKRYSSRRHRAD